MRYGVFLSKKTFKRKKGFTLPKPKAQRSEAANA